MPYIGVSPQFGVRRKHTYTATAGQTIFTGAGSEGATLSYTDSNFVDVYQNGVKLGDADYTSTTGTQIELAQAASVSDLVEIIVFDAFSVADTVSKSDGGTFDGNVTMGGTLDVTGVPTFTGRSVHSGGITIANGGQIGSVGDTDAMSISSSGIVTFTQTPVGAFISEADQFRLTADTSNGFNGSITSNLERVDEPTFSKIGTGMTESSGIFTFPSTGLYLIICTPMVIAVSDNSADVYTQVSSESGANFNNVARANGGGGGSSFDRNTGNSNAFINVTNTSTFQVKFYADSFGTSSRLVGDTDVNTTHFTFIKLGASQ